MAVDSGTLDQVTQQFLDAFRANSALLTYIAKGLFYKLALIQLTLSFLWLALTGESLMKLFSKFVSITALFGVLYACIQSGSQWVPLIINGFIEIGQHTGVMSIDPSSIVDQGLSISGAILQAFFNWGLLGHPFVAFVGGVVCIAILIIYALMAAELAIVLVKSYLLVSVSSLFFAFGATDVTRPMTVNYLKTVIGIGLQLMTLYLLMGVGQHIGQNWAEMTTQAAHQHELMPMLVILAAVIVYYMLVRNLPTFIAGLSGVGGFRNYGAETAGMAIHAGMSGASQLTKGLGVGGRMIQSGGQVSQALGAMAGGTPASWAKNVAHAAMRSTQDAVMRNNTHQSFGQRLNSHLANQINSVGS